MEQPLQLDNEWIETYENKERKLIENSDLEECPITAINVFNLYINKRNVLEKIKVNQIDINNSLNLEDLKQLIREKMIDEKIRYKLFSVLKYNITLEKDELFDFMNDKVSTTYLESLPELKDINFNKG